MWNPKFKERVCRGCTKEFKPNNGNQKTCKDCKKKLDYEYRRKWIQERPDKSSEYQKRSRKLHLEERRKKDNEYSKTPKRALQKKVNNDKYREKHRQRLREWQKRWRLNHKDYIYFMNSQCTYRLKNLGIFTYKEWLSLKDKFKNICPACLRAEPEIKLTMDHILPISKGGLNLVSNIQPLCGECNGKKYTKEIRYAQDISR